MPTGRLLVPPKRLQTHAVISALYLYSRPLQPDTYWPGNFPLPNPLGPFIVNKFTAPAYFLTVLAGFGVFMLSFCFKDYIPAEKKAVREAAYEKVATTETAEAKAPREDMDMRDIRNWTEVDWCILAGLFLNVFTKGSVGVYETLGVGVAVNEFGFVPAQAGYVVSTCGLIGVITLLFMKPIASRFHDTKLMVGGIAVMILSCCMLVNWTGGTMGTWRYYLAIYFMYVFDVVFFSQAGRVRDLRELCASNE